MRRPSRRRAALPGAALLAALSAFGLAGCRAPETDSVLLISIDTLRPDYLGCYDPAHSTPNIDALAARGALFTDVLAQGPATAISHKSIFSGLYKGVHRTGVRAVPREEPEMPVETLHAAGMRTGAFVGGGQLHPKYGFYKGFDEYAVAAEGDPTPLETLRGRARAWLEENGDEPFFLFLHTYQVHAPYKPPERYRERFAGWYEGDLDLSIKGWRKIHGVTKVGSEVKRLIRDLYAAQVAYVDDFMGWVAADLAELGLDERTMIVFLSDHGQSLGEDGVWGHNRLREVQLKVPLILRIPGLEPARIEAPVETVDVMPTIFSVLGRQPPYRFQGRDLLPHLRGEAPWPAERTRIAERGYKASVRDGRYKLIFKVRKKGAGNLRVLAGLEEKPWAGSGRRQVARELRGHYERTMKESAELRRRFRGHRNPARDPEVRRELEALGYLN